MVGQPNLPVPRAQPSEGSEPFCPDRAGMLTRSPTGTRQIGAAAARMSISVSVSMLTSRGGRSPHNRSWSSPAVLPMPLATIAPAGWMSRASCHSRSEVTSAPIPAVDRCRSSCGR
ncbi:MAG: hypothetical protein AUG49_20270 [Catenulispora sp. 13_1_20CM_3_70_7]|nr:MAG: hypothetical protein AUG49_20270 [Catenulispora sp. 13_1_20CM_3_70_7]